MISFFNDLYNKISRKHLNTLILVFMKSFGGLVFSWFLIHEFGEVNHVNIMQDLSIILGLSLFSRFGSDLLLIKLATKYFDLNSRKVLTSLLFLTLILCFLNSVCIYLIVTHFDIFKTVSNFQGVLASALISYTLCLMSFFKAFRAVNLSFTGETGMVMLLSIPFLFFFSVKFNVLILLTCIWSVIMVISIVLILYLIKKIPSSTDDLTSNIFNIKYDFFIPLPNLFVNSFLNYLQQWGIILLVAKNMDIYYASSFILVIRLSYLFNAVLSPLASYTVPEVIRKYNNMGVESVNEYISSTKKLYKASSVICFLITFLAAIYLLYPEKLEPVYVFMITFFLFVSAFNLASGPVNMYMALLGFEKKLIKIRLLISIPFVFILYNLHGIIFILFFSLYILIQRIYIVYFLKKESGIISV